MKLLIIFAGLISSQIIFANTQTCEMEKPTCEKAYRDAKKCVISKCQKEGFNDIDIITTDSKITKEETSCYQFIEADCKKIILQPGIFEELR